MLCLEAGGHLGGLGVANLARHPSPAANGLQLRLLSRESTLELVHAAPHLRQAGLGLDQRITHGRERRPRGLTGLRPAELAQRFGYIFQEAHATELIRRSGTSPVD